MSAYVIVLTVCLISQFGEVYCENRDGASIEDPAFVNQTACLASIEQLWSAVSTQADVYSFEAWCVDASKFLNQ